MGNRRKKAKSHKTKKKFLPKPKNNALDRRTVQSKRVHEAIAEIPPGENNDTQGESLHSKQLTVARQPLQQGKHQDCERSSGTSEPHGGSAKNTIPEVHTTQNDTTANDQTTADSPQTSPQISPTRLEVQRSDHPPKAYSRKKDGGKHKNCTRTEFCASVPKATSRKTDTNPEVNTGPNDATVNDEGSADSPEISPTLLEEIKEREALIEAHQLVEEVFRTAGEDRNADRFGDGNRIVDMAHIYKEFRRLENHQCPKDPNMGYLAFQYERKLGLGSILHFRCACCGVIRNISTVNDAPEKLNKASVAAMYSIGRGHRHLVQVLSHLGIPPTSYNVFRRLEDTLGDEYFNILTEEMIKAGQEEREIAIKKGRIRNGVPIITVIADACWSHRSFGHRYTAKSGVGVIIGKETKKILFLGVRNKYCSVCSIASKKKEKPPKHVCYRNWEGTSPSMEADIIVEGFRKSEEMHGVQYETLIADGDSSVLKHIRERVPYGRTVRKVECLNHLLKNVKKNLFKLQKDFGIAEKQFLTNQKIKGITKHIRLLINEFTMNENPEERDKLVRILKNIGKHYFGDHRECLKDECENSGSYAAINLNAKAASDIASIIESLTNHVDSIVENETTNLAEAFMHLITKFVGSKHVFYGRRGSFLWRACNAGLLHQFGPSWRTKTWKRIYRRSPPKVVRKVDDDISHKNILTAKRKMDAREQRRQQKRPDEDPDGATLPRIYNNSNIVRPKHFDYGISCNKPDLEEHIVNENKQARLSILNLDETARNLLEKNTIGQANNQLWINERHNRLTAYKFGEVYKNRGKFPGNLVRTIIYPTCFTTKAMRYGSENEANAIAKFEEETGKKVRQCGLFVHPDKGFLAVSPDGIVSEENGTESLIEVKCPYIARHKTLDEVATKGSSLCSVRNKKGEYELKKTHNYYFQVQGQLGVTKKEKCYFVLWCEKQIAIQEILFDPDLWQKMEEKLEAFYVNEMLPEIIDSRVGRNMPIRRSSEEYLKMKNDEREKELANESTARKDLDKEPPQKREKSATEQSKETASSVMSNKMTDESINVTSGKKRQSQRKNAPMKQSQTEPCQVVEIDNSETDSADEVFLHGHSYGDTIDELSDDGDKEEHLPLEVTTASITNNTGGNMLHLINGHLLDPVNVYGQIIQLANTCAFDSLATIIAIAIEERPGYRAVMKAANNTCQFARFCCMLAERAGEEELMKERGRILLTENIGVFTDLQYYDCQCNITKICDLFEKVPSMTIERLCANEECGVQQPIQRAFVQPPLDTLPNIHNPEVLLQEFSIIDIEKCKKCQRIDLIRTPVVGHHILIAVDALQDGSMTVVTPEHTKHFNIAELKEEIIVQSNRFVLTGVVRYMPHNLHYVAYIRRANGVWELHNDLETQPEYDPPLDVHINPHLLVYVRQESA